MDKENAKLLKNQTGQMHLSKKKAKRVHEKMVCPVTDCRKIVRRIHNHLRDTHKIKDQSLYRKLLKKATPYQELDTESEFESSSEEEDEDEYQLMKGIVRSGGANYLKGGKSNGDSDYTSDEDWLEIKLHQVTRAKYGMCSFYVYHFIFMLFFHLLSVCVCVCVGGIP